MKTHTLDVWRVGNHIDVVEEIVVNENEPKIVTLAQGESIRLVGTTSGRRLYGPTKVELHLWPDGGIDMRILPLDPLPTAPA